MAGRRPLHADAERGTDLRTVGLLGARRGGRLRRSRLQLVGGRLVDYEQIELRRLTYRDREAARLEYSWTALAKDTEFPGPYRAVDHMYLTRDGVEYALYMAGPAEDWDTTMQQFETILRGWREP